MSNALVSFAHYLFGWAILTIVLSWLFALIYPYTARPFSSMGAAGSAFYTLVLALLAPVTALVTLFILSSPTWAHFIVEPHCHGDLCKAHSLEFVMGTMLSTIALAMGVAAAVVVGLLMSSQLITNRCHSQMLERLSEFDNSGYRRFENPNRVARCFGLLKPRVFLSSGLVESLNAEQRQIILAHELAHASQYDNLRKWLVNWVTCVWPKKIRQQIRQDFSRLCESICDLKAFCTLSRSMETATFVDTLKSVYGTQSKHSDNTGQAIWQLRIDTLRKELMSQRSGNTAIRIHGIAIGALVTALWLVVTTASVYLGHPFLENLSY